MVVKIDISNVPSSLRPIILNQIEYKKQEQSDSNPSDIVTIEAEDDINKIERRIKDRLIESRIRDYVVVITDPLDEYKIVVLRKRDAERLGSFHCQHCSMEFGDEIQLGVHQRLHLPF